MMGMPAMNEPGRRVGASPAVGPAGMTRRRALLSQGKIRIVTAQTPKAGAEVAKGSIIRLASKVV